VAAFRRVEKMLFLFFGFGQARREKSWFLWHGERPSRYPLTDGVGLRVKGAIALT
jgi:hypothetical protein